MKLLIALLVLFSFLFGAASALFGGEVALIFFLLLFPLGFIIADYRIGVVLCMLALPIATLKIFAHLPGLNLASVMVIVTFGSFMLKHVMHKGGVASLPHIIWWRYILPIAVAVAIGVTHLREVTPLMAVDIGAGFASKSLYIVGYGIKPMLLIIAAWLLGNAVKDSKRPQLFLIPLVSAIVLPALILLLYIAKSGLGIKALSSQSARGFLTSLGMHANEFGAMFAIGLALLLFLVPVARGFWQRFFILSGAAVVLVALALTFSRGGYVAFFVIGAYFVITQNRIRLALTGVFLAVMLIAVAPQSIVDRAMVGIGGTGSHDVMSSRVQDDELSAGRFWMWRQTFPSFFKSPLIGSGIASQAWSDAAKSGIIHTIQTHNLYLSILYDVGLIGFGLVISFFYFLYQNFKRLAKRDDTPPLFAAAFHGSAAALLGMAVMAFTNGLFWPQTFQIYLWLMFGISIAYMTDSEKIASSKFEFGSRYKRRSSGLAIGK